MQHTNQMNAAVVALGNFDGVHLGHRRLIATTVSIAARKGLVPTVWSFKTHPSFFLRKSGAEVLTFPEDKQERLLALGVKRVILADFPTTSFLSPEEFVKTVLIDELKAAHVVCGFNYSFGKNAAGDPELLKNLLADYGVPLTVEAPVCYENEPVSSSRIRRLLETGEVERANLLLGQPFSLRAPVEQGKKLGRTFGFPTANQSFPAGSVKLKNGVYACRVLVNGKEYPAVTNVGVRPTVEKTSTPNCESHLLGFEEELYGQTIQCRFLRFLRPERRFENEALLFDQIKNDVREVLDYFEIHS